MHWPIVFIKVERPDLRPHPDPIINVGGFVRAMGKYYGTSKGGELVSQRYPSESQQSREQQPIDIPIRLPTHKTKGMSVVFIAINVKL